MHSGLFEAYYLLRFGSCTVGCVERLLYVKVWGMHSGLYEDYYMLRFVYAQWVV